jgi:hypothetical protein
MPALDRRPGDAAQGEGWRVARHAADRGAALLRALGLHPVLAAAVQCIAVRQRAVPATQGPLPSGAANAGNTAEVESTRAAAPMVSSLVMFISRDRLAGDCAWRLTRPQRIIRSRTLPRCCRRPYQPLDARVSGSVRAPGQTSHVRGSDSPDDRAGTMISAPT